MVFCENKHEGLYTVKYRSDICTTITKPKTLNLDFCFKTPFERMFLFILKQIEASFITTMVNHYTIFIVTCIIWRCQLKEKGHE